MKAKSVLLFAVLACTALPGFVRADAAPRERLCLDLHWRFHLGDEWGLAQNLAKAGSGYGPAFAAFSDASWRSVDLPHDWAVELPFDPKADGSHGFRALGAGFPENNVGWYRRKFALPAADAGRRIWLEFDGVYRDAIVYVNGWFVGHHESGYHSVRYDVTDVANVGGDNLVAVRVDASHNEGWFYEGAGIYRHVWLVKTSPVAIAPDGVFVHGDFSHNLPDGPAAVKVETTLTNTLAAPAIADVRWTILDPSGHPVAEGHETASAAPRGETGFRQKITVNQPQLWSPESPALYTLATTVTVDGKVVDEKRTPFGLRTFAFDAEKGFLLNGQPYVLKGTCNHQDHAGVGAALPDALQDFRIAALKKMGSNAYRTAHNPPTPELLDACDRLGMLVMDESRLVGSDELHLRWWRGQILRDRNHASVAIWSIGNEEFSVQSTPSGGRVAATMQAIVHEMDPTRPVTCNAAVGNDFTGINTTIQVRGWSYHIGTENMDAYHAAHPLQPNVGSEQGSTVSTRGIYANDPARGYVSAYDDNSTAWSNTAEQWVTFFAPRPWLSGGFVWTGFDYRGEPTPYYWPCINSHFGILDTCGFPKDNFYYYQSVWLAQPMVHVLPHWNWPGREGQPIDVRTQSNCDEVELFLNGQSLGRRQVVRNSELKWPVPYAAGTLAAKAYRAGRLVAEDSVVTTGAPAAVRLTAGQNSLTTAHGALAIVTVALTDANGRVVPTAGNHLQFEVEGPGRIIGVGNGDPSSHEPDVYFGQPAVQARAIDGWRWKMVHDIYDSTMIEYTPGFDDAKWDPLDVTTESGPIKGPGRAIFRAHFPVANADLAATGLELWIGKLDGDAVVYVNGRKIGPGSDPKSPSIYDVRAALHPGDNVVAVGVANYGEIGGVNKGASLRLVENPAAPTWQRSAFNGYAQVIVQPTAAGGTIKLTAKADGLAAGTLSIAVNPVPEDCAP